MKNDIEVLHDQHVHTIFSRDSGEELETYINKAIQKGCSYFVMTDHLDYNVADKDDDWISDYPKQREELIKLQPKYPGIKLLQGIELGFKEKYFDKIKEISESLPFDIVNLSIHDYQDIDFYYDESYIKYGTKNVVKMYLDQYIKAVKSDLDYQVVCHIDYAYKSAIRVEPNLRFNEFEEQIKEIMKVIVQKHKAYEINTKVMEFIPHADEHVRYVLRLYKSLGGTDLTLSSDAHEVKRLMSSFDHYKAIIKEEGFDKLCYFINKEKYYYYI